jgi:hydroxyacylglutathione hydrolase
MINVVPIPAFDDNYIWLIKGPDNKAVIVDPGDAEPVLSFISEEQRTLSAIIITHHHWDHIDGINDLLRFYDVPVYGPDSPRIPQITHKVKEGSIVTLFDAPLFELNVIEVPGHTRDHIAYTGLVNNKPAIFCGDTLFAAGCGRLFDGTHEQFCHSLQKINQLPAETQIFCTHEYTLANLKFAEAVEPSNQDIKNRIKNEQKKRLKHLPTLPTTLGLERRTNPFLRYHENDVTSAINAYWASEHSSPEALFTGLRRWKDEF